MFYSTVCKLLSLEDQYSTVVWFSSDNKSVVVNRNIRIFIQFKIKINDTECFVIYTVTNFFFFFIMFLMKADLFIDCEM